MASPKQEILNEISTALAEIKTSIGYYTNVQKVVKGLVVTPTKVPPDMRPCYLCIIYAGQSNNPTQQPGLQQAVAEYTIYASMSNVTSTNFYNVTDDIEARLSKDDVLRNTANTNSAFTILDSYVSNITVTDSSELDEVFRNSEEEYKDRAAVLSLVVTYLYDAKNLSGN